MRALTTTLFIPFGLVLVLAVQSVPAQTTGKAASNAAPANQKRHGQGLGRLLTTEAERTKIDDQRFYAATPPKPVQQLGPAMLQIDGVTVRPDRPIGQQVTVWIDGRAYLENALPPGLKLQKNTNQEVTGMTSKIGKNKTAFAQIGASIPRPQTPEEAEVETKLTQNLLKPSALTTAPTSPPSSTLDPKTSGAGEPNLSKIK
jgi:hypothetical protein